jgi:hypothetical protein
LQDTGAGDTMSDSPLKLTRRNALRGLALGFATPLLSSSQALDDNTHHDTVLLDATRQVIENFGASDCWSMQKLGTWSIANRRRVAELLFSRTSGIGLSCWRFNIGGGITDQIADPWRTAETFETAEGRYDWSRQSGERWFLAEAKANGVPKFLAFANSPPGRMTRTGVTFGQKGTDSTNLKPDFESRYARYLVDILEHFRQNPNVAERITFDYVSPVNEPNGDWYKNDQEGSRWSNADIKAVLVALSAELQRRHCPARITAPEIYGLPILMAVDNYRTKLYGSTYGNYLDEFCGDNAIAALLDHRLCYHDYGSDRLKGKLVENRQRLRAKFDQYPGWRPWMSEYCVMDGAEGKGGSHRDFTMDTALDVARIIHLDLTVVGVTAWQWWTAVSPADYKDGLIYTNWKKPGDEESILPSRLLWALGNFSRFVRPGMTRLELKGPQHDVQGLMGSAYLDEAGESVVAVYLNMTQQPQNIWMDFQAGARKWQVRSLTPFVTSDRAGDELKAYPAVEPGKSITIPPRSVVTVAAGFGG